jgi:hypothetical protein
MQSMTQLAPLDGRARLVAAFNACRPACSALAADELAECISWQQINGEHKERNL